jgi:putrescine aminotransferase
MAGPADPAGARSTAAWRRADAAHWLHPFTDPRALAHDGALLLERGDGVWLETHDGRRLLDAVSGLWCVQVGYGRRELVEAVARQLEQLSFAAAFAHAAHRPGIALAERLAALAPPGLDRVFFTNSGSEATETALRLVRRYWTLQGRPQRRLVLSRHAAFHGSTGAAAALAGIEAVRADLGLADAEALLAQAPSSWSHRIAARTEGRAALEDDAFGRAAAADVERRIVALGVERVGAFIAEPVQAAGGVIVPPDSYWPEVARICRRHDVLLVVDDVVCGFGRLGHWFGTQRYGLEPDLLTFAKGITSGYQPLGGVLLGRRVGDAIARGGELHHGHTTSGHPAACAAALANLELIAREDLLGRARGHVAPRLAALLADLATHPLVGEVQSCGLLAAVQLVPDRAEARDFAPGVPVGALAVREALDAGLLLRAVGSRLVLAPALVMDDAELSALGTRLADTLDRTAHALARRGWL